MAGESSRSVSSFNGLENSKEPFVRDGKGDMERITKSTTIIIIVTQQRFIPNARTPNNQAKDLSFIDPSSALPFATFQLHATGGKKILPRKKCYHLELHTKH